MGMPEYQDGSFGPIKPIEEALKDLQENREEQARIKALHIGKFEELKVLASEGQKAEPLAELLQAEFGKLRVDVDRIMIHLGLDNRAEVLLVGESPEKTK